MTNIPKKLKEEIKEITFGGVTGTVPKEPNPFELQGKINELIDYLQTKENKSYKTYKAASSVCCDSSFRLEGDTKEGTMYHVCNNCNKNCDIKLTEKKVKASKCLLSEARTCKKDGLNYVCEQKCPCFEASKGECACLCHIESVNICCDECLENHNPPENKGEYITGTFSGKNLEKFNPDPPEHEEIKEDEKWDEETEKKWKYKLQFGFINAYDLRWFINRNFVSKEKIKRDIDKLQKSCYEADGVIDGITALHHLREKLGLGD